MTASKYLNKILCTRFLLVSRLDLTMTANPVAVEYRSLIQYDREWQAIICPQCNGHATVGHRNLCRHFHDIHDLTSKDYKLLIKALNVSQLPMIRSLDQFSTPLNDSAPIKSLPIHAGAKCNHCGFLTTSSAIMKKHIQYEKKRKSKSKFYTVYSP